MCFRSFICCLVLRTNCGKLLSAFNPLRIRLGGSLQDQVVYNVGKVKNCSTFQKKEDGLFGFTEGCLPMDRWDELNQLFNRTGYIIYIYSLSLDFSHFKTLTMIINFVLSQCNDYIRVECSYREKRV